MDYLPTTKNVRVNGITMRYAEVPGPSPSILFLHGATDGLDGYRVPMAMLSGEHRLLALDFRGHGHSDHVPGAYRILDHVADVRAFLAAVVGAPTVIAGHSLGALVATGVGAVPSPLLRGIFLEDPPFYSARLPALRDTPDHQIFLGLRAMLSQHRGAGASVEALAEIVGAWPIHPRLFEGRSLLEVAGPEVVRARAEALHRLDLGVVEAILEGTQFDGFDPDEALAAIRVPVHLLAADIACGGTIEARDVERLGASVERYSYRQLPQVGHFIHHMAPADYVAELRAFAATCR